MVRPPSTAVASIPPWGRASATASRGGLYGEHPSLTEMDDGNLIKTTDFRRVYATMIKEWLGFDDTKTILNGDYETFKTFA